MGRISFFGALSLLTLAFPGWANEPMTGAFGFPFGVAVSGDHLFGASQSPPSVTLPAPLADANFEWRPDVARRWQNVEPPLVPKFFIEQRDKTNFSVLLDFEDRPIRLVAQLSTNACTEAKAEVATVLTDLYGEAATDPNQSLLFSAPPHFVQLRCGGSGLWLDYIDGMGYPAWAKEVNRRRRLEVAQHMTERRDEQLSGAFGFAFERRVVEAGLVGDVVAAVTPPKPFSAWPDATYRLMVDPSGMPVRIEAATRMSSGHAARAEKNRIVAALAELYGNPTRDVADQSIINHNGRYAIVRQQGHSVSVVLVDAAGLERLRIRMDERARQASAQRERQLAAERAGF